MSDLAQAEYPRLIQAVNPPDDRAQTMGNWLESPETRKTFKRNAGLKFPIPSSKKLRYESSSDYDPSSTTVETCLSTLPKDEPPVLGIPFGETITSLNDILSQVKDMRAELNGVREDNRQLREDHNQLSTKYNKSTNELMRFRNALIEPRVPLYKANMIVEHIKKLVKIGKEAGKIKKLPKSAKKSESGTKAEESKEHESLIRIQKDAECITQDVLDYARENHGLETKHFKVHEDLGKFRDDRNQSAHKTHKEFAVFLCSEGEYQKSKDYWRYSGLFPFVYGQTVEELAGYTPEPEQEEGEGEEMGEQI